MNADCVLRGLRDVCRDVRRVCRVRLRDVRRVRVCRVRRVRRDVCLARFADTCLARRNIRVHRAYLAFNPHVMFRDPSDRVRTRQSPRVLFAENL